MNFKYCVYLCTCERNFTFVHEATTNELSLSKVSSEGPTSTKNKGKMSRILAVKAALATRVDALYIESSDMVDTTIVYEE